MTAPAIAFDIDGVFKAGRFFFEDGLRALATGIAVCPFPHLSRLPSTSHSSRPHGSWFAILAKAAGCPVAFVTNGGAGFGEAEYLEALKQKIVGAAPEVGTPAFFVLLSMAHF